MPVSATAGPPGAASTSQPGADGLEVGHVLVGAAGSLEHHRGTGVADDGGEQVGVDLAVADVGVPVGAGVELVAAVVAVHEVDASGDRTHLVDDRLQRGAAGGGGAGVET